MEVEIKTDNFVENMNDPGRIMNRQYICHTPVIVDLLLIQTSCLRLFLFYAYTYESTFSHSQLFCPGIKLNHNRRS